MPNPIKFARSLHARKPRAMRYATCLAAVIAVVTAVSTMANCGDGINFQPSSYLEGLLSLVGTFAVFWCLLAALVFLWGPAWHAVRARHDCLIDSAPLSFCGRDVRRLTLVILAAWAIWVIPALPCMTDWDTLHQIAQSTTSAPTYYAARAVSVVIDHKYIDHDPFLTTLIYGAAHDLGQALGDQRIGYGAFVLLQAVLSATVLAAATCYLERLRVPRVLRLAVAVFVCVFVPYARYAADMLKDSLFAPLFLAFLLCYCEAARTRGEFLRRPRNLVATIAFATLSILTKKVGAYVVVPSLLVLVPLCRPTWGRALVALCVPVALGVVAFPALSYACFDLAPGGRQESLGFTMQQVATVLKYDGDSVSQEDREAIERVMPIDQVLKVYDPTFIDPTKNLYEWDASSEDVSAYLKAWVHLGLTHPWHYVQSTVKVAGSLFIPSTPIEIPVTSCEEAVPALDRYEGDTGIDTTQPYALKQLNDAASGYYYNTLLQLVPQALKIGTYGGLLPLLALFAALYRRNRSGAVMVPIALASLSMLVCPGAITRYALPLMYATPLMLGLILSPQAPAEGTSSERG